MRIVLAVLLLVFFVLFVGKVAGRLLGIRLGSWRGAFVGAVGWLLGAVAAAYTIGETTADGGREVKVDGFEDAVAAFAVVTFFGVLAAMPLAIGLDLLTRGAPRARPRRRRRGLLHPVRTVRLALAPYGRLRELVGNARRANLLHLRFASASGLESPEVARRVRTVLEESGGMLVKLGQIASTRGDVLPAPLVAELANLRADVAPIGADAVRSVLEDELAEPVEQAFDAFEWEPLAAASIGQTHRAVLHDGTRVVVKVQRPGIDDVVDRDAAVLRLAARQLERRVGAARAIGLRALSDELIGGLEEELHYLHEAAVGTALRAHRAGDVGIAVPGVHTALSTDRVLVMEEVVGRSIVDPAALEASPVGRQELARRLLSSYLGQVLDDGMFHADPHPGNLLLDAGGTIWMLDFGSVGRLGPGVLEGLRGLAIGVALSDPGVLARATRDLAAGGATTVDLRALEADLAVALGQLESPGGLDPALVGEVIMVMRRHGLGVPPSVTLLARSLLTLEGTLKALDPSFSLGAEGKRIVGEEHRDAFGTPQEILEREALRSLPALRTLPEHAEALADQLRAGRLTLRTERFAGGDRAVVDAWVDRLVIAVIGGAGTLASSVLLFAAAQTDDETVHDALLILGFSGLAFGTILLMRGAARALRRTSGRID